MGVTNDVSRLANNVRTILRSAHLTGKQRSSEIDSKQTPVSSGDRASNQHPLKACAHVFRLRLSNSPSSSLSFVISRFAREVRNGGGSQLSHIRRRGETSVNVAQNGLLTD